MARAASERLAHRITLMPRAAQPLVMRAGPREASGARTLRVSGRPVTVALVLELRGAIGEQERALLLRELRETALKALVEARGGLTARLRTSLGALDRELRREAAGRSGPLVAGASLAATTAEDLLLAQAGPAVAYLATAEQPPERLPARGPWLRREALAATQVEQQPPLGGGPGGVVGPHILWTQRPAATGTRLLLATTPAAGALPREVTSAIFATPLARAGNALDAALPQGTSALLLAPVDPPLVPAMAEGEGQSQGMQRPPVGAAAIRDHFEQRLARARDTVTTHGRRFGLAGSRGAAKVLLGLFPTRMAADRGGADWMRLAATAVLALPVAALLLTALLVTRERRENPQPATAPEQVGAMSQADGGASSGQAEAVAEITVADRAAGISRLTDLRLEAALAGDATEERDLVAVGAARYVLNRQRGLVEWIIDGAARVAWQRGSTVGGVVAGAPVDLFWLAAPSGAEGGRATVLDEAGRLWPLDGDRSSVLPPLDDLSWQSVIRASGYDGRLYLLDRGGRVHRYTPVEGSGATGAESLVFSDPPEAWLQVGLDLSRAVDLAIDGRVLVLNEDGLIWALQGGGPTDFAVGGMPEGMTTPRALYASPSVDQMLVADHGAGEVIVLGENGAFRARLRLPPQPRAPAGSPQAEGRLPELHSVWWDESAGRLWLVAGNALYQAAFEGAARLQP